MRRLFGRHLIKPGEIETEWAAHLGESLDDRLAADYDPEVSFTKKEARRECSQTQQFVRRIRRYLLDSGFKASELRKRATDG